MKVVPKDAKLAATEQALYAANEKIKGMDAALAQMRTAMDDARAGIWTNLYGAALNGGHEHPFEAASIGLEQFNTLFSKAVVGGESVQ